MHLNAYLSFSGNCEAAFAFYVKHLGGEIMEQHRYAGSPMEAQCPPGWGDTPSTCSHHLRPSSRVLAAMTR